MLIVGEKQESIDNIAIVWIQQVLAYVRMVQYKRLYLFDGSIMIDEPPLIEEDIYMKNQSGMVLVDNIFRVLITIDELYNIFTERKQRMMHGIRKPEDNEIIYVVVSNYQWIEPMIRVMEQRDVSEFEEMNMEFPDVEVNNDKPAPSTDDPFALVNSMMDDLNEELHSMGMAEQSNTGKGNKISYSKKLKNKKMDSNHVTESTSGQEDIQKTWWKEAIIYQIYPRSFQDSDGDGIGDLNGITSRLDYIQSLGVDIIWLNPIFLSPNDDNGYDISDYREIMREFGTMEDFDRLLKEIHKREMRLVLDLVVNHTSDEHPWFEEARKSRHNPYYNYYHWWPAEKGEPPLRLSYFDEEGNAWTYNKSTDSYYLHYFSRKQPDLNWENPEVRQEIFDMMRFWFDKGIDGFRMDSISLIAKDPSFPLIDSKKYPDIFSFYAKEPRLHLYLHEMNRQVLSKYDCMSVGEGSAVMVDDVAKFVDPAREELNMLYHFDAARIRNTTLPDNPESGIDYSLIALKKMFTEWDKAVDKGWPSIYLGNHDQPRMVSRFGSDKDEFRALSAKMLITFLLTMRGTPYWFAGDEIGMRNIRFDRIEDYNDIDTINRYKKAKAEGKDPQAVLDEQKETGRDNARTPFQWDRSPEAGFTAGTPWLKVNPDYTWINVADEEKDPTSILNYFKKVVSFRKENLSLIYGSYHLLDAENPQSYTFLRKTGADTYLIMLNFSPKAAISTPGIDMSNAHVLLDNYGDRSHMAPQKDITLRPFEAIVFQLNHPVYESFIDSLDLLE